MNETKNESTVKTNWLYLVFAFLLALGIWAVADENQTALRDTTIKDIPVEYVGEDTTLANKGLMLMEGSDRYVTIKLEGPRTVIADLDPDTVRIQVDLSNVYAIGYQNLAYRIVYENRSSYFTANLSNISAENTVGIQVGALSQKEIEIRYDIHGNVADGYIAGKIEVTPDVLSVQGRADEVSAVSYAEVILNIDNATESVDETLKYVLYDFHDNPITEHSLRVSEEEVRVTMPVNIIKEIPLKIDFVEDVGSRLSNTNWKLEPSSITVYGDASALAGLDSILLDTIVLAGLDGDMTYNYVIPLPDGCENISGITRAELKLSFKDLLIKSVEAGIFECENQPKGKEVKVLTAHLPITLRGPSADLKSVSASDITVVADLSDISSASGNYTVPAEIRLNTTGDIAIIGSYQIRVNISEPPPPPPDPPAPVEPETPTETSADTPTDATTNTQEENPVVVVPT